MAVYAIEEFDTHPSGLAQWVEYYNYDGDERYIQVLPFTTAVQSDIVTSPSGVTRLNGEVTLTTVQEHGYTVGDTVVVAGATDSSFNGEFVVTTLVDAYNVKYAQAGTNVSSGDGTVDPAYPRFVALGSNQTVRDSIRPNDTLSRSKYLGRDYNTFLDEGLAWLRDNYRDNFTDFVSSDFGLMFAKYVSAAMDTLAWYMDHEVSEWFYPLLRLRARAEMLSQMSGYKARAATACSGDLTLTLTDGPYAFDIEVPKGFQWPTDNGLVVELSQAVPFAAGETIKLLQSAVQGETREDSFTSTGEPNYQAVLSELEDDEYLALGSFETHVENVKWDEEDFIPFTQTDAYEVFYFSTPALVQFGNGVSGNVPEEGASIVIGYLVTAGKLGQAITSGTVGPDPVEPLVVNFETVPITATNPVGFSGGDDPESLTSIVKSAPAYFKTADRGTTKGDITSLTNQFADGSAGTVAMGKANIVRGIAQDYALQALLATVDGHATDLATHMADIASSADDIDAAVAVVQTSVDTARTDRESVDGEVTAIKASTVDANADLATAKTGLLRLPYQQRLVQGDGIVKAWTSIQLDKFAVAPGTVYFWVDQLTTDLSGSAGNCDTSPGLLSGVTGLTSGHLGRAVLIGNQTRQVTEIVSATVMRYSGEPITGTAISWIVYDPTVFGIDDGNGGFTGVGIVAGNCSVDYPTGQVAIELSKVPDGNAGYGVDVLCQFNYEDESVSGSIDGAISDLSDIDTSADDIATATGSVETELAAIETQLAAIGVSTTSIGDEVALALAIPAAIEADVDALEAYLDEHLSSECRANIVMVQALVVDENGFYAAPSQALLTALKTYLDARNVVPTTIATVSGYHNVLAVNITFSLNIVTPYKFDEVVSRLSPKVDTLLRGRLYDLDLHRSDYYNITVPDDDGLGGTPGVNYANITITATAFPDPANTGTPPGVDSNGNLFIGEDIVISKGTITFEEIV